MTTAECKDFLDYKCEFYNNSSFIHSDPISIPHEYSNPKDIEIAAFLTALISWGNRKAIIRSAKQLMEFIDNEPYDFIMNACPSDMKQLHSFTYRTFQKSDPVFYIQALQNVYLNHGGLENVFAQGYSKTDSVFNSISFVRSIFFETPHLLRNEKHFSNPEKGAASKRIHLFLRWMIRNDNKGVDFGIWNCIPVSQLICPLDLHTGNVARKLGLLKRKTNDRIAAEELTWSLSKFDPSDPVKYDFALFGLGIFEKF